MIPGQLSTVDRNRICEIASSVPPGGIIVEVGSLYGLSASLWATGAPASRVVCIDPWKHEPWIDKIKAEFDTVDLSIEAFRANVADYPNIEPIQGYSPACAEGWHEPIDVYFDDADHRNPNLAANISFWAQHVKIGGVACGHDYNDNHSDVVKEAMALAERWGSDLIVYGSVWSVQRR